MRVIKASEVPVFGPGRYLSVAASMPGCIADLAKSLRTRPYKYKDGEGLNGPLYLRRIYFELDTGAYAAIYEEDVVGKREYLLASAIRHPKTGRTYLDDNKFYEPGKLEIELLLHDHRYFFDEDLNEVVGFLGIDPGLVKKYPGLVPSANYWQSTRKYGFREKSP